MSQITIGSMEKVHQNPKILADKLKETLDKDNELVKKYFSYLKESPLRGERVKFGAYLNFLKEIIIPQVNEKYEDKKTKYKSEEEFEEYQSSLFDVLVEVNDYLWENYLFLDRSLRWEYADKVISKIDGDCFKRFLYTKKPKKMELETPGDLEKINAYNKVLDSFFYRNIRSLILSRGQCNDLFPAFHKNVDKLPDWINQYIDPSNQNDFLTTLSGDFVTLTNKIESFDWSKKLDKDNKMARECLEEIKKVSCSHKDFFDFYVNFLETAIIPQINKFYYEEQHFSGLFEILVETNDLIWGILESNSLSEYEKNRLSACYYNCITKISGNAWKEIGSLLKKRKEEAIESKNKNEVAEYNRIVENFVLRNLKSDVISANKHDNMGVINFIDEQTFEEYTDDSMSKKLLDLLAYFEYDSLGLGVHIHPQSTIKIRKPDKNKKICFEAMFGGMMSSMHCPSSDTMLSLIKNSPDDIDFSFSSLSDKDVKSSEEIKKFCLGFRSVYDDLKKNDFTIDISKPSLNVTKCFMYLGAWTVLFFPKNVDFDTVYTELNKRLDFLCDSHYGLPKLEITQKQKDKLIIQALVYATNVLAPLSNDVKSVYRTLRMFTGEEKFVDGYKFSLDDMKKILSSTKNSVLNSFKVLKFCKNHRAKNVRIFDILRLAKKMNISIGGKRQTGCDVCLEDNRNGRISVTGYRSISYNLFDRNDFEIYMSELPENPEEKEFDMWFSFFLTKPILPKKRSSYENKKIREVFVQIVDKIPDEYLNAGEFYSLVNYFVSEDTANAINLYPDEFNNFISKVKKQMDEECFKSFKKMTVQYFRINDKTISDKEIENAYNGVKDVENPYFEDINAIEGVNEIQEMNNNAIVGSNNVQDINESKIINKNIEADNFEKNMAEAPVPSYQNIEITKIRVKIEELKTRKSDLENQITELKRDAEELSHKNWVVQKFLGIFYYILNLIKKSKLNKIDKQITDSEKQLEALQNSEKPKKSSDALSELEEQPVPNMQSELFIIKNKNK